MLYTLGKAQMHMQNNLPVMLSCDDVKPAELLPVHCSQPVRPGPRLSVLSAESVDRSDPCFVQTS